MTETITAYDPEILTRLEEKGIVIVHGAFYGSGAIRIWSTTYLIDHTSGHRSRLLHAENISCAPVWTRVGSNGIRFTLYFEALPSSCTRFDLHEIIPQPGGFLIPGIIRNQEDVYRVEIK